MMKLTQTFRALLPSILLTIATVSCTVPTTSAAPAASTTPMILPSLTPAPTSVPTSTPTRTATRTPTPFPSPTATVHNCLLDPGRMEIHELDSELLPKPMPFRVYLPPCYDQNPDMHYPVLYMIHGQSYNDDQWERLGAPAAADRLISAGEVAPFIIVMPRDRELATGPETNHFAESVSQELVPWIDDHYRTLPDRDHRAVGGLSRGAGWALHLALSDWELYGALGSHSMAIFWADTHSIKEWLSEIPYEQLPRIYIDIGDHDRQMMLSSVTWFEDLLTQRGIPHEFHLFTGYHEEKYWEEHVEDYLRWYAGDW